MTRRPLLIVASAALVSAWIALASEANRHRDGANEPAEPRSPATYASSPAPAPPPAGDPSAQPYIPPPQPVVSIPPVAMPDPSRPPSWTPVLAEPGPPAPPDPFKID